MGNDSDKKRPQSDENRLQLEAGRQGRWFGFRLTGPSERDVRRLDGAAAFAFVAIALTSLVFAFSLVWDRVSMLWK